MERGRAILLIFGLMLWTAGCGGESPQSAGTSPVDSSKESAPVIDSDQVAKSNLAKAAFEELVQSYKDGEVELWEKAQETLVELGEASVPTLAGALRSSEPETRELATIVLARLGPNASSAADDLLDVLDDESLFVRVNAASVLSHDERHASRVVPVLIALLKSDDVNVRRPAVFALGNFRTAAAAAVPALEELKDDEDVQLREDARTTLERIKPDKPE